MGKLIYLSEHQKPELTGNALIQSKIEQSGYTMRFVSMQLGITEKQLKMRLDGKKEFYVTELFRLFNLMKFSDRERNAVFEE